MNDYRYLKILACDRVSFTQTSHPLSGASRKRLLTASSGIQHETKERHLTMSNVQSPPPSHPFFKKPSTQPKSALPPHGPCRTAAHPTGALMLETKSLGPKAPHTPFAGPGAPKYSHTPLPRLKHTFDGQSTQPNKPPQRGPSLPLSTPPNRYGPRVLSLTADGSEAILISPPF